MTNKELLKELEKELGKDKELEEEATLMDILDYLAVVGLEGASKMYFKNINA